MDPLAQRPGVVAVRFLVPRQCRFGTCNCRPKPMSEFTESKKTMIHEVLVVAKSRTDVQKRAWRQKPSHPLLQVVCSSFQREPIPQNLNVLQGVLAIFRINGFLLGQNCAQQGRRHDDGLAYLLREALHAASRASRNSTGQQFQSQAPRIKAEAPLECLVRHPELCPPSTDSEHNPEKQSRTIPLTSSLRPP